MRDHIQERIRTGVPLLVDIPLLGALFGGTRTRTTETELFVFITPTIIDSDEDIASETLGIIDKLPSHLLEHEFISDRPVTVPPVRPPRRQRPGSEP